ncbi:TIGR02391 family protein [Streptomyces albidoflavus]
MSESRHNHDRHATIHPWIDAGTRQLLLNGHHREAVHRAANLLTHHTQQKLGRSDISDANLMHQAFSDDAPSPGRPRLRVHGIAGSQTVRSRQQGIRMLSAGSFSAIRNPAAHGVSPYTFDEAIEQIFTLSFTARTIDECYVLTD